MFATTDEATTDEPTTGDPTTGDPTTDDPTTDDPTTALQSLEWLETATPGAQLAAALAAIDSDGLSAEDRVSVLVAQHRLISHYQAKAFENVAVLESQVCGGDGPYHRAVEETAVEIGAALRLTRRAAEAETHLALELARRLPAVMGALSAGEIDLPGNHQWTSPLNRTYLTIGRSP